MKWNRVVIVMLFVLLFVIALYADTKTESCVELGDVNIGMFQSLAIAAGLVGIIYDSRKQGRMIGEIKGSQSEIKELIKLSHENIEKNVERHEVIIQQHDNRLDKVEQFQAVCRALKAEVNK